MNWPFFKSKGDPLKEELHHVKTQLSSLCEQMTEYEKSMQKLLRMQFKNGKNIEDKMIAITSMLGDKQKNTTPFPSVKLAVDKLIQQMDDMDMIDENLPTDSQWKQTIQNWQSRTLHALSDLGVEECVKPGGTFDPRYAEAIETVAPLEHQKSNEITSVYKRAFINPHGEIIRKGQVITVWEEI